MYKAATAVLISLLAYQLDATAQTPAADGNAPTPTTNAAPAAATAAPDSAAPAAHRIAPCEGAPHCVSSSSGDPDRYVAPIRYNGSDAAAQQAMLKILSGLTDVKVVAVSPGYVHAEFRSMVMRFVDDVEMVFGEHQIQLRSSSRIGYYDFGVNRRRVEDLRKAFGQVQP